MNREFNNHIASVKEAILKDRLVIFAGAGISKDSGVPLWDELAEKMRNRLNIPTTDENPIDIAQTLYNEKGEKEYTEIIKEILFTDNLSYNPIHEILFELNPQNIITTNYDTFLERYIYDSGLPFSSISKDEDLPYANHKKLLIKYHGDFDNHNIVLKTDDYSNFSNYHTLKEVFVKSLFSNKIILFVGYSVTDPNLKILINEVQHLLKKHFQRTYMITTKNRSITDDIKYYQNLGVNSIFFDSESLEKKLSNKNKLSKTGNKLFSILKYIRDFKLYEYRNQIKNPTSTSLIINELYHSMIRFQNIRVLPKKTVADLYPLNKHSKESTSARTRGIVLKCFYNDLFDVFDKYQDHKNANFDEDEKVKLDYCISRLKWAGFHSIGKAGNPDSWGTYGITNEVNFETNSKRSNCKCINCLLDSLDYSKALENIFLYTINEKSDLKDDLGFFYGLYRVQDYFNCFNVLKRIIIKANRNNKFDISFIAKYNLKRLMWQIGTDYRLEWNKIKELQLEIEKIDLDKELEKVKYFVDYDLYKLLKEIKEGTYIQKICNEIDEIYNKVPKTVESIERGGWHSNYDFENTYRATNELEKFLKKNFLLNNGYSPIYDTFRKSIHTFVLGYYLKKISDINPQRHHSIPHLSKFDTSIINIIIHYSEHKELIKLFEKHNIKLIEIEKKSIGKIYQYVNNFLKSSYKLNRMFGNNDSANDFYLSKIRENRNFEHNIKNKFNTICIVVAYFKFSDFQIQTIYKNLKKFIQYVDFESHELDSFSWFLYKKSSLLIDEKEILDNLKIFEKKRLINSSYFSLLRILKERNSDFTYDDVLLNEINFSNNIGEVNSIYNILSEQKKKEFKIELNKQLKTSKDTQLYYIALNYNIIRTQRVKNDYINLIKSFLEKTDENDFQDLDFFNWRTKQFFDLVNKQILDISSMILKPDINSKIKFLINPEKFPPEDFDVDWLKIYNWDSFLKRYSNIEYIKISLENSLNQDFNSDLGKIYFKLTPS